MANLSGSLVISRCPHCAIANPSLGRNHQFETRAHDGTNHRVWGVYVCGTCGGAVSAWSDRPGNPVRAYYPQAEAVDPDIPDRPRAFLHQAQESLHAPAGAVMLAASSVDAMLKLKGYAQGTLYARIEKAVSDHLMTQEMAAWAHAIRLDANDQRHADESANLPTEQDAQRSIEFAKALGEFLFVLPSRIQRGINE